MARVSLNHLMYVRYSHTDLHASRKFFLDFGFTIVSESKERVLYRGFGADPCALISEKTLDGKRKFLGGGWAVDSLADLELAASYPGATSITDAEEAIGGKMVALKDPAGGPMYLHWGFHQRSMEAQEKEMPKALKFNTWDNKRRLGEFQRLPDGPSRIHKLGHYGFEVNHSTFNVTIQWYLRKFTLARTDSLYKPETGEDIMVFMHLDRGEEYVDHHVSVFPCLGHRQKQNCEKAVS